MQSVSNSAIVFVAYLYLALQKLFQLPAYVYVLMFFVASLIATTLALSPIQLSKYRLASSSQSLEEYARFLLSTQASGNDVIAQRVLQSLSPALAKQPPWMQHDFHDIVFPQERIEAQLKFWSAVALQQPNAREVNAALTILSFQTFQQEKFQQYLQHWKQIEPNDPRLAAFSPTD